MLYADDTKAASKSAEFLQRKADIISALCIILGLQMSESKIRRVVQTFLPTKQHAAVMFTTVHAVGWVPHSVPVQSSSATEFLGGIHDMDDSSKTTLE